MTTPSVTASQAHHVRPGHLHRSAGPLTRTPGQAEPAGPTATASAGAPSPTAPVGAPPASTGLANFAAELQSILISAQAAQTAQPGSTTAATAVTVGATSATPSGSPGVTGPALHLADRLQQLLGDSVGAVPNARGTSNPSTALQTVLDRLQLSLQHTLQAYAPATPSSGSSVSV